MSTNIESVEVAVVFIFDATGRVLLDYNSQWHQFTLPMCKRQPVTVEQGDAATVEELLGHTALRAAIEVIGRPLLREPLAVPVDVPPYHPSARDGVWKRYNYHVFAMKYDATPHPLPGHSAVWLTPAELEAAEPISPTVRSILRAIPLAELAKRVG